MIEQAIIDMTFDAPPASAVSGLVGFSERLARAESVDAIFATLAGFVAAEGLGDLTLDLRPPAGRGKLARWTTLAAEPAGAFGEDPSERMLGELLSTGDRPAAIGWSVNPCPGLRLLDDTPVRRLLLEAGIAGGIVAAMDLPSGRSAASYALASPKLMAAISEFSRDLFLIASIQAFLALDRSFGGVPPVDLTRRELEALRLAARGLNDRQVAAAMGISEPTVKFHLAGSRRKLNAKTTKEAVASLSVFPRM